MSKRHKRSRQEQMPKPVTVLEVTTESSLPGGGNYVVTVAWKQDRIWRVGPDEALNYVLACTLAAERADFDAAVLRQLTGIGVPLPDVGMVIARDLRPDRPELTDALPGLRYEPGVTEKGKPFVKVLIDGVVQDETLDLDLINRHCLHVLGAPVVADLDNSYRQALIGQFGMEPATATNIVHDLAKWRWKP